MKIAYDYYYPRGFEILGIDAEDWSRQLTYARQYNWVFLRDAYDSVSYLYRLQFWLPMNYVIDREGIVRYGDYGFDEGAIRWTIEQWLGVEDETTGTSVKRFSLAQNQPNPAKKSTEIVFSLPIAENVRLRLYDTEGRLVRTLAQGTQNAGIHRIKVLGLESGIYLYRLEAGGASLTRMMIVVK